MKIALCDLIVSLSVALDYVEMQLLGVADCHSRRIAYLSYRLSEAAGYTPELCRAIAQAAILHDNALKEFVEDESYVSEDGKIVPKHDERIMQKHCIVGEDNISDLPFYPLIKGAVLYHHEHADGGGAFGKHADEIPLSARLIHIADIVDATWNLSKITPEKLNSVIMWVNDREGTVFDSECVRAFNEVCTYGEIEKLSNERVMVSVRETLREPTCEIDAGVLIPFSAIFAKITDYKSRFTCSHSLGIAEKAYEMAKYYGWDEETQEKMYFAGAMHDIGKLMINNNVLEKPDRLTNEEFANMKAHARATYDILSGIRGIEDITSWASMHHEKLDGSGYPFGKTAEELGQKERLMACIYIYQALVEKRPYKNGMSHGEAMVILHDMAQHNKIDSSIVDDIDRRFFA